MRVTISYLSCGCMIWLQPGTAMITVNGRCPRCGHADTDTVIREQRTVKEPAAE